MKLALFGATGATGRHLLEQALTRGHHVTALARDAASLPTDHPGLTVVLGHIAQPEAVLRVVRGQDAVISVLGVRDGGPVTICSDGARAIIAAMRTAGTRRLIALSAYGASETRHASLLIRFVRAVIADKMRDKDAMEALVRDSGLDWTLVRPPILTNGAASGTYRAGAAPRMAAFARIARADVAHFLLREAAEAADIGQAVIVTG